MILYALSDPYPTVSGGSVEVVGIDHDMGGNMGAVPGWWSDND